MVVNAGQSTYTLAFIIVVCFCYLLPTLSLFQLCSILPPNEPPVTHTAIANEFIKKIRVYVPENLDRKRVQKVYIILNFVREINFLSAT